MPGLESLILIFGVFAVFMFIQSRSAKKRQAQHTQTLEERLVPGAWVMTTAGFYGRFVDRDGQVVILETVDGHETYWSERAIREVVDTPPFDLEDEQAATTAGDAPVAAAGTADDDVAPDPLAAADEKSAVTDDQTPGESR